MKEMVNHPAHYNAPGHKECIEEMLEKFGPEKVRAFCELNAYKYRYRHEMKNGEEDLRKAEWYENKMKEYGDGWIPVSERLPERYESVLAYDGADIGVAWVWSPKEERWNSFDENIDYDTVTHWRPLPASPHD